MRYRNWLVAGVALFLGVAVSAALVVFGNPTRDEVDVYAINRDLPSGAQITPDGLRLVAVAFPDGGPPLFEARDAPRLRGAHATHDLFAGQLLQRGDVSASAAQPDVRLVYVPVKDAPPASAGSRLDLLVISGTPGQPSVVPFALGVEVRAVVSGGFVVAVSSRQAPAFVYAAEVMHLVAVISSPDAPAGNEEPVGAPDQALAMAGQP